MKKEMTVKELATLGGRARFKKYGKKGMKDMVKKRWANHYEKKKI